MAVQFETAYANSSTEELGQKLAGGTFEFQTAGEVKISAITLASVGDPASAFVSVATKTGTYGNTIADPDPTGGEAAIGVFKNSGGTAIYSVSVTATGGGGDVTVPNTTIPAHVPVNMSVSDPMKFIKP